MKFTLNPVLLAQRLARLLFGGLRPGHEAEIVPGFRQRSKRRGPFAARRREWLRWRRRIVFKPTWRRHAEIRQAAKQARCLYCRTFPARPGHDCCCREHKFLLLREVIAPFREEMNAA